MVLNKLWIPDDMINEIKDYLYISAAEVLRKFYRSNVNRSITDLTLTSNYLIDVYGRQRIVHWATGHTYGGGDIQFQDMMCVTCGDFNHRHNNMNGCCPQQFDLVDEPIYLVEDYWEGPDQEPEQIPEVTWVVDIPAQNPDIPYVPTAEEAEVIQQQAENALWGREPEHYDYDDDIADYEEYMREIEMEAYEGRRSR